MDRLIFTFFYDCPRFGDGCDDCPGDCEGGGCWTFPASWAFAVDPDAVHLDFDCFAGVGRVDVDAVRVALFPDADCPALVGEGAVAVFVGDPGGHGCLP